MAQATEEYIVALDLGSSTTRCAIASFRSDGELVLEGYAERPSRGVRKGLIVDAPAAAHGVKEAVRAASERAGVRVGTVLASVATPYARGLSSRGCIGITRDDRLVRGSDAQRALAAANRVALPRDRAVTEVLSQGFAVDTLRGLHNPVGLAGGRLEAEVHVVTDLAAAHESVRQVVRAVPSGLKRCTLERALFGPAAAAAAVLSEEEKQLGGVHLDIGAGTTSLVLYCDGYPRFTRVLPIGSEHITQDLAIALNTPLAAAERLKRRPGLLAARRPRRGGDSPRVEVPLADGSESRAYPLWRLGFVVRARVEEIFDLASRELDRSGLGIASCARVVLTGGYCRMDGALDAARRVLRRPVRMGAVVLESALAPFEPDPTHAVVLSTLLRGAACREARRDRRFREAGWRGLVQRVAGWF